MVTIQFYLTEYGGLVSGTSASSSREIVFPETFGGSITVLQATKDNIIEYIAHKQEILNSEELAEDDDGYLTAEAEMYTLPVSLDDLYILRAVSDDSTDRELIEISGDSFELLKVVGAEIYRALGTTLYLTIWFGPNPADFRNFEAVTFNIDIATNTITSFGLRGGEDLIDEWDYNKAIISEVSGSGPAGWTGKDGYVDNDKSLESAFISNAKPGNAGSTATYKTDEDGYYYLYSVEG